jgi:hypothetical protein
MGQEGTAQTTGSDSEGAPLGVAQGNQGMVPQFGDSVLERLVEMSTLNGDAEYRQMLTDRVIAESLVVAGLEREQANYEEIIRALQTARTAIEGSEFDMERSTIQSGLDETFDAVVSVVGHVNTIYQELSTYNLNPTTLLYSVTSAFTHRTERSVSVRDLAMYGLLVFMLSLITVPAVCLGYSYFRREVVPQETDGQHVGQAVGGQAKGLSEEELAKQNANARRHSRGTTV